MKMPQKFIPIFIVEERIVKCDLGNPRQDAADQVFEARLRYGGHRDRVPVATEARRDPENIDLGTGCTRLSAESNRWAGNSSAAI